MEVMYFHEITVAIECGASVFIFHQFFSVVKCFLKTDDATHFWVDGMGVGAYVLLHEHLRLHSDTAMFYSFVTNVLGRF